jgi:hypothetical protein
MARLSGRLSRTDMLRGYWPDVYRRRTILCGRLWLYEEEFDPAIPNSFWKTS